MGGGSLTENPGVQGIMNPLFFNFNFFSLALTNLLGNDTTE